MTVMKDIMPQLGALAGGIDLMYWLQTALVLAAAACILGGGLRLIFGRGSAIVQAVAACVTLALVYTSAAALYALLPEIRNMIPPLPFFTVTPEAATCHDPLQADAAALCSELLRLFILAVLVNLSESLLPTGQRLLSWYGFRCLSVCITLGGYFGFCCLTELLLPQFFGSYAVWILLGIWGFILLTGLLRLLLGIILAVINPLIAAIYAFFFSNLIGKQITKSILTAVGFTLLLAVLARLGFHGIDFSAFSLLTYGPICLILLAALYLFGRLI